jgi:hypothetical protein
MFLNVKWYDAAGALVHETNPYDAEAGTLVGLEDYTYFDPHGVLPPPRSLGWDGITEEHLDALVYEMHPSSSLTEEQHSFHFALADGRSKDNRIPPMGFRIDEAAARDVVPVDPATHAENPDYFTAAEYVGGYDDVELTVPAGAVSARIELNYQTTSREYVEFLRDEILATEGRTTLGSPTPSGEPEAYVIGTDPWFDQLRAWGGTLWDLWTHNMTLPGAAPIVIADEEWGSPPPPPCPLLPVPQAVTATPGKKEVTVAWDAVSDPEVTGYSVWYDQAGKLQWVADVEVPETSHVDRGLTGGVEYCYVVTSFDEEGCESAPSAPPACATPDGGGGGGGGGKGGGKK